MRRLAMIALASLLAGCGATSKMAQTPTTLAALDRPSAPKPAGEAGPLMAQETLSVAPAAPPAQKLQCDAPSLTYLIGHKRTDIPVPADLSHRRVACTTCPGNSDYEPNRTDILFNANTGLITAVTCG